MRRAFKMSPQVFRLVLLAVGIVTSYAAARYCLTPKSFRQYGWYRGEALVELSSRARVFAGKAACEECHAEQVKKVAAHGHKSLSCEACHGPAQAHADDPDNQGKLATKPHYTQCVRCHEANPSRPKWHKQIVIKDHYTSGKCTECHLPHLPEEAP